MSTLLEVKDLKMYFPITQGIIIQRHVGDVKAVDGLNFKIRRGEDRYRMAQRASEIRRR